VEMYCGMAVEDIVRYGHDGLRKPADKVGKFDDGVRALIARMFEVMKEASGLGLAANQVGVPLQVLTYDLGEGPHALVNPKIVKRKGELTGVEGCLSVPGIQGEVPRAEEIIVKGMDENGKPVRVHAKEMLARVLQHEIDHLQGCLFIDRADPETLYEVHKHDEDIEEDLSVESGEAAG